MRVSMDFTDKITDIFADFTDKFYRYSASFLAKFADNKRVPYEFFLHFFRK